MHYTQRKQAGFTLTEIAAALAVASVRLSLVVPSLRQISASNQQAVAVNTLVADLHQARSEAITGNRSVAVCPSRTGTTCDRGDWVNGWIRFADADRNGARTPPEPLLGARGPVATGVDLRTQAFASGLTFDPRGTLASGGSFWVCGAKTGQDQLLYVTPTGHPRLERLADGTRVCDPD